MVHIVSILFSERDIERTNGKCLLFACAQEENSCGHPSPKMPPMVSSLSWATFLTKGPLFQKPRMKWWALKMANGADSAWHARDLLASVIVLLLCSFLNAFGTLLLCLPLCHSSECSHSPFLFLLLWLNIQRKATQWRDGLFDLQFQVIVCHLSVRNSEQKVTLHPQWKQGAIAFSLHCLKITLVVCMSVHVYVMVTWGTVCVCMSKDNFWELSPSSTQLQLRQSPLLAKPSRKFFLHSHSVQDLMSRECCHP